MYIHYIQYFNFLQSWNIIFKRLYTILYVQCTQFFKECYFQEMYPIMYFYPTQIFKERTQFCILIEHNFPNNIYNFVPSIRTILFIKVKILFIQCIHFFNFVISLYTNFQILYIQYTQFLKHVYNFVYSTYTISKNVHNYKYSNYPNFQKNINNFVYLMWGPSNLWARPTHPWGIQRSKPRRAMAQAR